LLNSIFVPINRAGWPFIAAFAAAALLLGALFEPLGWAGLVLTLWCVYFFRDPPRVTPDRDGLVVSPADGLVLPVTAAPPPAELGLGDAARTRISIFMNVFDVHVNRIPAAGRVTKCAYRKGKFLNASLDKASVDNERMAVAMKTTDERDLAFVQIAGLVARRIKCELSEGQPVVTGERFGLIRFGSRVDVYLPEGIEPLVVAGQRAIAGETVLADFRAQEPARQGETR